MNTTTDTRTAEIEAAREADTLIAAAWAAYWEALTATAPHAAAAKDAAKRIKYARSAETRETFERRLAKAREAIAEIEAAAEPLRQNASDLDKALYTGWTRFFLVQHIHNTTHCSSFRPTTQIGWLPNLSGLTEAEAVAEHGAILCTICFPSAPVEYTRGVQDDRCEGSGKSAYNGLPQRTGFYGGNWVTCATCGKQVGIGRSGYNVPKHTA